MEKHDISIEARRLRMGEEFPYDITDDGSFVPASDWAVSAARGVLADLRDRAGIKWGFDNIDHDIRVEIVTSLAAIIRLAAKGSTP